MIAETGMWLFFSYQP